MFMYHYVYLIENLINGKIYIGKHSTENFDDGYMGSGKLITKAISKYGIENFRKQILQEFETAQDALEYEKTIVDEQFVNDNNTYNLHVGGGDWSCANRLLTHEQRKESMKVAREALWKNAVYRAEHSERMRKRAKKMWHEGKFRVPSFAGHTHTEEFKKKIGEINSARQSGVNNSCFGMTWITNVELKCSKRVKNDEVQSWLDQGWTKGRKIKW